MKALKTNRFDVEENSWNFDIMENITSLLEMIPSKTGILTFQRFCMTVYFVLFPFPLFL